MNTLFNQRLNWLSNQPSEHLQFHRGLEKEGLRTNLQGVISQADHPMALGSALTHSSITTDYSEALLEFITSVNQNPAQNLSALNHLHHFTYLNLKDELVWPGSMPSKLEGELSIRIAEYGESNIGKLKHVYRHGLWHRYGRIMQSIAGLHFNFSLNEKFWPAFQDLLQKQQTQQDFISSQYFGLIRNFRRYSWLLMYVYGASPATDGSFFEQNKHNLEQINGSYLSPYATSLRMSDVGYTNKAQDSLYVCFNGLKGYIDNLTEAIATRYPDYDKIGIKDGNVFKQMNSNILQIENEYYSDVRPKRVARSGEKPVCALSSRGVEYIEVRCLDLNPYEPLGISEEQIYFLDVFLLWCLLKDSPIMVDDECERTRRNLATSVSLGRKPGLELEGQDKPFNMVSTAQELMSEIKDVAGVLANTSGDMSYFSCTDHVENRLQDPELLPSQKIFKAIKSGQSYSDLMLELAQKHRKSITQHPLPESHKKALEQETTKSLLRQREIEQGDKIPFEQFLKEYQKQKPC